MKKPNIFKYYKTSPEIIKLAVMYYVRFPLSLRNVEDILHERGVDVCHETIRYWWNKFGGHFAKELRKANKHKPSHWRWHVDEVFVKINGKTHYLWRAIDHEGVVIDCYVSTKRNTKAALKFLRKSIRRYGFPKEIVTDKLKSYGAALRKLDAAHLQRTGRYTNNMVENSHLPFRRRERGMNRFRLANSLQKFVSIHAVFHNHFNNQRNLNNREDYKNLRDISLSQWNEIAVS